MPVPPLSNSFEGGSDTALISGGSGGASGTSFDTIQGAPTFSADHPAHGTLGMKITDPTSNQFVDWHNFGSITTSVWARFYLWIPSTPLATFLRAAAFYDSGGAPRASFEIQPTTRFARVHSGVATAQAASPIAFPLNTMVRVELRGIANAGAGEVEASWWSIMDSAGPPTETMLLTGQNNGANINGISIGAQNTFPTTPYSYYFDDLAISSTGWIGPVVSPSALQVAVPTVQYW